MTDSDRKSLIEHVTFEWTYTPVDYWKEPIDFYLDSCKANVHMDNGKVVVSINNPNNVKSIDKLKNEIWKRIYHKFIVRQLLSHKPFALSERPVSECRVDEQGNKAVTIYAETAYISISSMSVDVEIIRDGRIIYSSKREREELEREILLLLNKHGDDDRVKEIIKELQLAAENKREALMHLFKIHEILRDKKTLLCKCNPGLRNKWDNFKKFCNDSSLDISRHKNSKYIGQFRKVTPEEIKKAWNTITEIVLAYLRYLGDKQGS